jgi:hypothetical protein
MSLTPESERGLVVRGPGWWITAAILAALLARVSPVWPGDPLSVEQITSAMIPIGLAWATLSLLAAEGMRRSAPDDPMTVVKAQPFSGAAIIGVGLALSALAMRIRSGAVDIDPATKWRLWMSGATLVALASLQLYLSTRRLILKGRDANDRLEISEREAHAAELMALQQQLDPGLLMNALAAVAARADVSTKDAERAVEGLAAYLRRSLKTTPGVEATLDEELVRAGEYADIMALAGVQSPIVWRVDADVRDILVPAGTLRTFLDYAISRCVRDESNTPTITVRSYKHAQRFYLIVTDTAAPDPPMLAEPESLAALRRRLGAPPQRRARVETHVLLEVDGTFAGTTQTLSMRLKEAA